MTGAPLMRQTWQIRRLRRFWRNIPIVGLLALPAALMLAPPASAAPASAAPASAARPAAPSGGASPAAGWRYWDA